MHLISDLRGSKSIRTSNATAIPSVVLDLPLG
jgi:hypothetical protein